MPRSANARERASQGRRAASAQPSARSRSSLSDASSALPGGVAQSSDAKAHATYAASSDERHPRAARRREGPPARQAHHQRERHCEERCRIPVAREVTAAVRSQVEPEPRAPGSPAGRARRRAASSRREPSRAGAGMGRPALGYVGRIHEDLVLNSSNRRFQPKHSLYSKRSSARRRLRSIRVWRNEKGEGMMIGGDQPGRGRKPLRVSLTVL